MIELQITGLKEIESRLNNLEKKVSKQLVRTSMRGGARVMFTAIRSNIAGVVGGVMGSRMMKALAVRAWKKQRRGQYGVAVRFLAEKEDLRRKRQIGVSSFVGYKMGSASSIKSKKLIQGGRYFIPWAIEYGHAFPGRGGRKGAPKDVPARSYFRSAFDSSTEAAMRVIRYVFLEGISRYGG